MKYQQKAIKKARKWEEKDQRRKIEKDKNCDDEEEEEMREGFEKLLIECHVKQITSRDGKFHQIFKFKRIKV